MSTMQQSLMSKDQEMQGIKWNQKEGSIAERVIGLNLTLHWLLHSRVSCIARPSSHIEGNFLLKRMKLLIQDHHRQLWGSSAMLHSSLFLSLTNQCATKVR